jgi:dihydroorotate dehydrogenase electron transfer subunit
MSVVHPAHRNSIALEDATVIDQIQWPNDQYILRLHAPRCAARATPGAFVHLTCDADRPMRRPLSIQRADPATGTIEILYKIVGDGLKALSGARRGDTLSCLGPIGQGFKADPTRPKALMIGGGVGMPPMIFLAERLQQNSSDGFQPLVLLGSEIPFPFRARPSTLLLPGLPAGTIAAHPDLDALGIPSRLASRAGIAGAYAGFVTELAAEWLLSLDATALSQVTLYACGPTPMLKACARLAQRMGIPAQISLEEFMACAVGGCAGCTIEVATPQGPAMKRVCVDGPVFDANSVFPSEPATPAN